MKLCKRGSPLNLARETLMTRNLRENLTSTQKESPTEILNPLTTWVVSPPSLQFQEGLDHLSLRNLLESLLTIEISSWRPFLKLKPLKTRRKKKLIFQSSLRTLRRTLTALLPQSTLCHRLHRIINLRSVMHAPLPRGLSKMMLFLLSLGNLRGLDQLRKRSQKIPEKTRDQEANQLPKPKITQDLRPRKPLQQLLVSLQEAGWSWKWCLNQRWMVCLRRASSPADLESIQNRERNPDPRTRSHHPREDETYNINKGLYLV